jgi:DNA-binding CsgD family transcriptional regulator
MGLAFATIAAAEIGDDEIATTLCDANEAVFGGRPFWVHSALQAWGRGVVRVQRHDLDDARHDLLDSLDQHLQQQSALFGRFTAVDLAELAVETGSTEDVERACADIRRLGPTAIPGLRACDDFVEGAVHLVAGEPDRAAPALARARETFGDAAWPLFEARAGVLEARALARADRAAAVAHLEAAIALLTSCQASVRRQRALDALDGLGNTGRRARTAVDGPEALTKREREVARLAVEGLSAKEIGARLFIGERTVETHLANVYAKLGVRSRVELVRMAPELDLSVAAKRR